MPERDSTAPDSSAPSPVSRRAFLQPGSTAALAAAALAQRVEAQSPGPQAVPTQRLDHNPARLIAQRATMGYRPADHAAIIRTGWQAWRDEQLRPQTIADTDLDARLASFPSLQMNGSQLMAKFGYNVHEIAQELRVARLLRATFSKRQLLERVVQFWTDHFNIDLHSEDADYLKLVDDREVVRRHGLGRFRDLLHASAKSGAMIAYLNNDSNVVGRPNENYARELLELHTLGVDGPYIEQDVRELARCFTGWTFVKRNEPGIYGAFRFDSSKHDNGAKQLLGLRLPAGGGVRDAEIVLDHLAGHPKTASFVATKMIRWFLNYAPPQAFVQEVANEFLRTGGDLRTVIRKILSPTGLALAEPKLKRPYHFAVSLLRALEAPLPNPLGAVWSLSSLGQESFSWPAPNGYPDAYGAWASNLLPRWQYASQVCHGWWGVGGLDFADIQQRIGPGPRAEWPQRINQRLTGGAMGADELRSLAQFAGSFQWPGPQDLGQLLALAAMSPTFQHH